MVNRSSPHPVLPKRPTEHHWVVPERTESSLVDQLLSNRGITDRERFFHPDYDRDSHDPFLLPSMEQAVSRILTAIERKQRIAVYADYDADGIPGGALLVKLLRANDANVVSYIPDREKEGYGLNEPAIDTLKGQGVELIITVDLGITNRSAVASAAASGIDVIVTDHHGIDPERLPSEAIATVHPALPGSKFPFAGLAGGGVAWKLAQAVANRTRRPTLNELKWWLELPAISTVCDLVPLVDESRTITSFGLKVLRKTRSIGLRAMYQTAAIDPTTTTERTVGFQIGPRINAPGRIDHASSAMELLLTDDPARATALATQIEQLNRDRQILVQRVMDEAVVKISSFGSDLPKVMILSDSGWPIGVLGVAASRLVERYHRPVILLNETTDQRLKGSARSIEGFNVLEALTAQRDLLQSFGGHSLAAGLALEHAALADFSTALGEFAAARLTEDQLTRRFRADATIDPTELTDELLTTLDRFAPFGVANPTPRFVIETLTVQSVRRLGTEGQHLKLTFANTQFPVLAWRFSERGLTEPTVGQSIMLLGRPEWNDWNGHRSIQLIADDWRPADPSSIKG
jgi:single-stranded-DNA-specific exonuclease